MHQQITLNLLKFDFMKKLLYINLLIAFFLLCSFVSKAEFGFFGSAVYIEKNGSSAFYNCFVTPGQEIGPFSFSSSLGTFAQNSGLLKLQGAEMKTWKDNWSNVCEPIFNYRIYTSGSPSGSFTSENLPIFCNCSSGSFSCGGGSCGGNDQKWQKPGNTGSGMNVDLTTYAPGTYTIEVYYQIPGSVNSTTGCTDSKWDNNGGNPTNYTASFTITTPLPVTLSSFMGKSVKEGVQLWWDAQSESNFKKYEIEKSKDNLYWNTIGTVLPNSISKYSFLDSKPFIGDNYYRLKQIDLDGNYFFSNIITLSQNINSIFIYPNPVISTLEIKGNGIFENSQIRITDVFGRTVLIQDFTKNINVSSLIAGNYWLKIIDENNNEIDNIRFVKL